MNIAMIFAGGTGKRMKSSSVPKQFLELYNKPIIIYTLEKFENNSHIDGIVVSCLPAWIPKLEHMVKKFNLQKVKAIVPGGSNGQESIYNGLVKVEELYPQKDTVVLIHDGVRPLVDSKTISNNIKSVKANGNAITITPAIETIIQEEDTHKIQRIIDRKECQLARAPQSFYLKDIISCHRKAIEEKKDDFIDSATMLEYYGYDLYTVLGTPENIKITTPIDFYLFRALIDAENDRQVMG